MAGRTPLREYQARRIALIKPSSLGDIVHALPVLTALRRRFPDAHLTWIVNRAYEPLLLGHPDLDATLAFDRAALGRGWARGLRAFSQFLHACRRQRFDLVLDLQGLLRSGLIAAATGARRRVGLASAREGARWFYTDRVDDGDLRAVHAVDRYWQVADALGAGDTPKCFRVPVHEAERGWALAQLQSSPRPWLALAVGARWLTKRWPPASFAVLARQAQERFGGTAIFVGGGEDQPLSRRTTELMPGPVLDLTGRTTLPRLAALLSVVDVMIANDTGPLHLAVALGRPVVAPYTCTKVCTTGPYGGQRGAVETRVWCQGSYLKRCARLDCMTELTPARLWPALEETLLAWRNSRSA